jgi:putative hydrolase of the HAD superfamily
VATEYEISVEKLRECYTGVLKRKTAMAFTDGKSSDEYRKERFAAVLDEFDLQYADVFLG